jgi:tetratricopeptide (TPR) repeat protein
MPQLLRRLAALLIVASIAAGCATAPTEPAPVQLFADALFAPPPQPVRRDEVFALDDAMRGYLAGDFARHARAVGAQQALIDALTQPGRLRLAYDATTTRNAAQAFDAGAGNCLSLALMTAAFAKALDLRVDFNRAVADDTWSRLGDLLVVSGHVNTSFGRRKLEIGVVRVQPPVTIDFLPPEELRGLRTEPVDEPTVVAMYFNNRAAETLIQGGLDQAYAYAREAVRSDPRFLPAYNTLGLVYRHHGQPELALRAFDYVLARDPHQRQAMANLADTLQALGRDAEAARWRETLARLEPDPPFHYLELGRAAAQRGDWAEAKRQFERELARADYSAEVHFWMALANWHLGDYDAARRHLAQAVDNSTTGADRALYSAKLARLNAVSQR